MPCDVLIGGQWGDEGKAKAVDYLCSELDTHYVVRYHGGSNAGHTVVYEDKKVVFHLIPSCVLHKDKFSVIANGVVFDCSVFAKEIHSLQSMGISLENRLLVSPNCHLVMPYHYLFDVCEEANKTTHTVIGTTKKGIGPCYADKHSRKGIRILDLYKNNFKQILKAVLEEKNFILEHYYKRKPIELESLYQEYIHYSKLIEPYLGDTFYLLNKVLKEDKTVLCEGAQGTLLDIDFGFYPYVTSSSTISSSFSSGTGISLDKLRDVYGIFKCYVTRVGSGVFPTEFEADSSIGSYLQASGCEYGATTGRLRRCGWFDVVLANYSISINSINKIFLTKLDVLDDLEEIQICTKYQGKNGEIISSLNFESHENIQDLIPIYEIFPGWKKSTKDLKSYDDLPSEAKNLVHFIQENLNAPILYISTGSDRRSTITL